ncbi:MAG: Flp pilus assembly protein CpaB [Phycisphaerales bacterium]|nr:Flp pilus assembly protein CpaB [Phycisphaerales bacterium]
MNMRAIIPLALGLGLGIFAIKMFMNVLQKAQGASNVDTVEVVKAKQEIPATSEITADMVEMVTVPQALAPRGSITDQKKVIRRVASQTIPEGVTIFNAMLAPEGTPPGMISRIPEGYRAVAVKVDEIVGVGGWVKPGSYVDVAVVMDVKCNNNRGTVSKVVLQNVQVLAIGQTIQAQGNTGASIARSVTLMIRPNDVPKLHLAASKGQLRLALRGQHDSQSGKERLATETDLLGLSQPQTQNEQKTTGFLQRWLGKQCMSETQQADNKSTSLAMASALPTQPPPSDWIVEVMSGTKTYQVRFENDRKGARRLDDKSSRESMRAPMPSVLPPAGEGRWTGAETTGDAVSPLTATE